MECRPTEEERMEVATMAGDLAKTYATASKQNEAPNLYAKKFARYKQHVDNDVVRVEQVGHDLFQQWISRKQAVQIGVMFHDPVKWIEEREKELGRF